MHVLNELARDRQRQLLACASEQRQVSQTQTLRKALRRAQRAQRRLIAAEVSVREARSSLVLDCD